MQAAFGTDAMPETAENVAKELNIARADQDAFAFRSQRRAALAIEAGLLAHEIVPVSVPGKAGSVSVAKDEHPRPETTLEGLAKLKPIVRADGSVTAGNSSGINDGACAVLLASEPALTRHALRPLARVVAVAAAGVAPRLMGMGPVPATQRVLALAGLPLAQMALIELNEAFAAQAVAVLRALGLPDDAPFVNPNGGAIALGHPLGASGARLVTTAVHQLRRSGARYALCTMCIGVGQGLSMILERA
jgi:acetyl-CoA acetyltransferase family protein